MEIEEEKIEETEIRCAIKKIKLKKAADIDGIPMEAWKFADVELEKKLVELIKLIWKKVQYRLNGRKA